jgi:hypothetical protein
MPRRLLAVLSVCAVAALTVTAVAFAHGGGSGDRHGSKGHKRTTHAKHSGQPTDFLAAGLLGPAVTSLAQRLDVDPTALRTAIKAVAAEEADKRLQAAGLTPDEIAAVKACRTHGVRKGGAAVAARHAGTACRSDAFKSGASKLKAAAKTKPDLAALKTDLATSLATKLGKTPDEVLAAVRAELDARLTQAVTAGWLTQKGHDLALACFDTPASCDLKALRAEVTLFGHKHKKHHARTGSGQMHPGGRATSAPLR